MIPKNTATIKLTRVCTEDESENYDMAKCVPELNLTEKPLEYFRVEGGATRPLQQRAAEVNHP